MDIKAFAEKFIEAEKEAWDKGNFELLGKLEDPNMVVHMPLSLPDLVGQEAHIQSIKDARRNYADIQQEFQKL